MAARVRLMKLSLQLAIGILLILGSQASGQDVSGRFYPEKQNYIVGEPVFVVLEMTNVSSKVIELDDGHCVSLTRFEAQAAWRQMSPLAPKQGTGGSCASTIAPWPPKLTITRRFLLEGPFRLDSAGVYPMKGHHNVCVRPFDEGSTPCKTEEIVTDFDVSLSSASETKKARDQSQQDFAINLLVGIKSEQVQIVYFLTGSFGGYGMTARPESGKHEYRITTMVDGKAADTLKALVYSPGCQIAKISVSSLISTTEAGFTCQATTSLPFTGRIEQLAALRGHDYEVEITLIAHWAMDFFEIADGIVPTFRIASLTPDDGGYFRGQLPDVTQDVLASSVGNNNAAFHLTAREKSTGNILGVLQPTDKKYDRFGDLRLQPTYPDDIIFRVR
jgi:hypothetical protein